MKIGVLDIQGSVAEHVEALKKCKVSVVLVKKISDLEGLSGLIIPGGESTTIGKLLKKYGLDKAIIEHARKGMAVWGTCAGAILLAKKVVEEKGKTFVNNLGLIDITIERNAYGRQINSFETDIDFDLKKIPAVFIRAPKILKIGEGVKILAKYGKEIVAVRQGKILVTTFHPELTGDLVVHRAFAVICRE